MGSKDSDAWATLYNRIGVVKRHFNRPKVFSFSFVEGFEFGVAVAFVSLLMRPRPAFQNPAVEIWFHQPSIRSLYLRP
jgi:hypothetical protein